MAYENTARVITIPATEQPEAIVLRVAAYCRVSSSSDEQLNSFAAQNRYYTELISGNENWKLVDIYADEGITGTSIEKREDFKRMILDCERGLIDIILVKSISRFARNTTECLETVRMLKAHGISVFFEKENIDTGKVSGEMLTAVFASLAQAESESISKNMRWSYQKRMEAGTFVPSSMPYGYNLVDGIITINEREAKNVQMIYEMYLSGISKRSIAQALNDKGIRTRSGQSWSFSSIMYILTNEKYTGNSIWQKTYQTDSLPREQKKNRGERSKYFAKNTHPAIITQGTYDLAQKMRNTRMEARNATGTPTKCGLTFNRILLCGECNSTFRSRFDKGKMYWLCNKHANLANDCRVQPIPEQGILNAFIRLYYKLKRKPEILESLLKNLIALRNSKMLWSTDVIELNKQISDTLSQNQMLTTLKQQGLVDPDIFISKSNELSKQLRELKLKKEALLNSESDDCIAQTRQLIDVISDAPEFINEFDDELFNELVDKIIVESNTSLIFRLKNGLELRETIERSSR